MSGMNWEHATRRDKVARYDRGSRKPNSPGLPKATTARFASTYKGTCPICGDGYPIGTVITRDKFLDKYVHARCKK